MVRTPSRRGTAVGGVLLVVVVGVVAALLVGLRSSADTTPVAGGLDAPDLPRVTAEPTPKSPCDDGAERAFSPTSVDVPGVQDDISVLALPRDARDIPQTPPTSGTGKNVFAWDRPPGVRPGSQHGHVLLNAHTFPDGSALGNRLLDGLQAGDRIMLRGNGQKLCYEVTRRREVPNDPNPYGYYDTKGKPEVAIVVCSGDRLGPGQWTKRTLWFASPVTT